MNCWCRKSVFWQTSRSLQYSTCALSLDMDWSDQQTSLVIQSCSQIWASYLHVSHAAAAWCSLSPAFHWSELLSSLDTGQYFQTAAVRLEYLKNLIRVVYVLQTAQHDSLIIFYIGLHHIALMLYFLVRCLLFLALCSTFRAKNVDPCRSSE